MKSRRAAVVTGAHGGLGSAVVRKLAADGVDVLGVDLVGDGNLHVDVGTSAGNREMVRAALERFGRLDILVLNAGVQANWPIADADEADWDRLHAVMAKGPLLGIKHAWPELTRAPGGRIIIVASTQSFVAGRYQAAYVAAKHAVVGVMRTASVEGCKLGLTANAVAPGWMMTNMTETQMSDLMRLHGMSREQLIEKWSTAAAGGRSIEPEEVAEVIAFLASPESSGVNGAVIPVDLGILAAYFE